MKARGHLRSVGERGRGAAAATPGPEVATLVMEMMGAADTDTEHTGTRIPAITGPYNSNGKYLRTKCCFSSTNYISNRLVFKLGSYGIKTIELGFG